MSHGEKVNETNRFFLTYKQLFQNSALMSCPHNITIQQPDSQQILRFILS